MAKIPIYDKCPICEGTNLILSRPFGGNSVYQDCLDCSKDFGHKMTIGFKDCKDENINTDFDSLFDSSSGNSR